MDIMLHFVGVPYTTVLFHNASFIPDSCLKQPHMYKCSSS